MRNIGIFCASSNDLDSIYFEEAARLGAYIGQQKKTLVYGGNAKGLMEAIAQAVSENGGNVMGIIPKIIYDRGGVSKYVNLNRNYSVPLIHDEEEISGYDLAAWCYCTFMSAFPSMQDKLQMPYAEHYEKAKADIGMD